MTRDRPRGTLIELIAATDPVVRDRALDDECARLDLAGLLAECAALDAWRRDEPNLYHRVRGLLFLYAIHRYWLPRQPALPAVGRIPFAGHRLVLQRRFAEALDVFLAAWREQGPSDALASALAQAYRCLAFQTLADQVRRSVRSVRGNQWMFRIGHPDDHPLRIRPELAPATDSATPILVERTPVRLDLSHSCWSDIFFLGMDHPDGARVLNVSIDLAVHGRDPEPWPPIETALRVLDEPVLRLVSVDLGGSADLRDLGEVFDFARDHLGLLKAAVIASGLVPPGLEGSSASLGEVLARVCGPGRGIELVSFVRDIPKGSRLAVSTNLLGSLIAVCMRATGQARSLEGPLSEAERRIAAARAILGEWLGGSGGGWQDSGGLWPGVKRIEGRVAGPDDPEFGTSRGRLLPDHTPIDGGAELHESLVLVHGGMAQNVGPILEMVTEKYLLRSADEWRCRQEAVAGMDTLVAHVQAGDLRRIAEFTSWNFAGPIQGIVPWATNLFTETVIERVRERFGDDYRGFCMLGGMSGGGMGFFFAKDARARAQTELQDILSSTRQELQSALPFAMEPVVYDFAINRSGTAATLRTGEGAMMHPRYYALLAPELVRGNGAPTSPRRRAELLRLADACRARPEFAAVTASVLDRLLPTACATAVDGRDLRALLDAHGFDRAQHEQIREAIRRGSLGLARNRLPANASLEDVATDDLLDALGGRSATERRLGEAALADGAVAVVTLAAGAASRWTQGAGVVKALHPFCRLAGRHRSFLEAHLAKTRASAHTAGRPIAHVVTTSWLTHEPICAFLARIGADPHVLALPSPGRAIGLRLVPMVRDLRFLWEETAQQRLDVQAQKVRDSLHAAWIAWAEQSGEGSDYTDNLPRQCLHPVGHWYEVPNLLRNGVLASLIEQQPGLRHLMLHNVDTLGANLDPELLGAHIEGGAALTFEVIPRRVDDQGGGLCRVDGRLRLVEGLALPREEDELRLSFYNTLTTWIDIDRLFAAFGLARGDLAERERVDRAVASLAARMPTYVTIKDVKKRWGHGHEDVFPVAQFERLWGDLSALPDIACRYLAVPRRRGQQLKDPGQLDAWLREGSAEPFADRRFSKF